MKTSVWHGWPCTSINFLTDIIVSTIHQYLFLWDHIYFNHIHCKSLFPRIFSLLCLWYKLTTYFLKSKQKRIKIDSKQKKSLNKKKMIFFLREDKIKIALKWVSQIKSCPNILNFYVHPDPKKIFHSHHQTKNK